MANEIDFDELLGKYKSDPFDYVDVFAVHTGRVTFKVVEGEEVSGSRYRGQDYMKLTGNGIRKSLQHRPMALWIRLISSLMASLLKREKNL